MKKIFLFFLLIIISPILAKALTEVEHSVEATVTINPFAGRLNVSPEYLAVNAPPLTLVEKILTFQQEGNIDLNVSLYLEESEINDWFSFSESEFILKPLEKKEIKTFINIPEIEPGHYSTNIHSIANNQDLITSVNITIPEYFISISVPSTISFGIVYRGYKSTEITITITNKGSLPVTVQPVLDNSSDALFSNIKFGEAGSVDTLIGSYATSAIEAQVLCDGNTINQGEFCSGTFSWENPSTIYTQLDLTTYTGSAGTKTGKIYYIAMDATP